MDWPGPLEEGRFLKRYKRFFADIQTGSQTVTAHVPNTGSLKTCLYEEAPCRYTTNNDPKRKLKYTLQMIQTPQGWAGVNTQLPNHLVWEAWKNQKIPHWKEFDEAQKEVKLHDKTRIDLVLKNSRNDSFHYIEVKNVTMAEGSVAKFPDAVTTRGQKHLEELITLQQAGHTTEIVFTVQREGVKSFSPAHEIDPKYSELLKKAQKKGVKVTPLLCQFSQNGLFIDGEALPVEF